MTANSQKPTVGRIVLYHENAEVWPAIITRVFTDDTVNLCVFKDWMPAMTKSSVVKEATPQGWWWPPLVLVSSQK